MAEISTSKYYYHDIPYREIKDPMAKVHVIQGSCFDIANKFKNPVIHNFANNIIPGGPTSHFSNDGIFQSSNPKGKTQEDQIVRRYQKNLLLPKALYPIIDEKIPNSETLLYSKTGEIPVITLPSVIMPNFQKKRDIDTLLKRMYLILYVSSICGNDLITGLWGCGAFGANPEAMADLWKYAIQTSKYSPPNIVFCIYLDRYTQSKGIGYYEKLFKFS